MAGCVSCFVIPLLLFLFHRFIQPLILKFWNPWQTDPKQGEKGALECLRNGKCSRGNKTKHENGVANGGGLVGEDVRSSNCKED